MLGVRAVPPRGGSEIFMDLRTGVGNENRFDVEYENRKVYSSIKLYEELNGQLQTPSAFEIFVEFYILLFIFSSSSGIVMATLPHVSRPPRAVKASGRLSRPTNFLSVKVIPRI